MAALHMEEGVQEPHVHLAFGETSVCSFLCAHLAGEKWQEDLTTRLFVRLLMGKAPLNPPTPRIQVSRSPARAAGQVSECQAGALLHTVPMLKSKHSGPRYSSELGLPRALSLMVLIQYLKYWFC